MGPGRGFARWRAGGADRRGGGRIATLGPAGLVPARALGPAPCPRCAEECDTEQDCDDADHGPDCLTTHERAADPSDALTEPEPADSAEDDTADRSGPPVR